MMRDERDLSIEFEQELSTFTANINTLIHRLGVPGQLSSLYSESLEKVDNVREQVRPKVEQFDGVAIKLSLKELQFFNATFKLEGGRQKKCGIKRMLDAGGVILESISKFLSGTKLGIVLDVVAEITKLATGLYYDERKV